MWSVTLLNCCNYIFKIFFRSRFPHLLGRELKKPVALRTVHMQLKLPTKSHSKASTALHKIAVAVVRYMFLVWSISISHQQSAVWWWMHQSLHLRTLNCCQNMVAFTTVQHVLLGRILIMYTLQLVVTHSRRQHSWSMLTVAARQDMSMGIFTFLISRHLGDQ